MSYLDKYAEMPGWPEYRDAHYLDILKELEAQNHPSGTNVKSLAAMHTLIAFSAAVEREKERHRQGEPNLANLAARVAAIEAQQKKLGIASAKDIPAMVKKAVTKHGDMLLKALGEFRKVNVDGLVSRVDALEQTQIRNAGVWRADGEYRPGDMVTDKGSAWHCQTQNVGARPGTSDCWRLLVKRGRDLRRPAKGEVDDQH